MHLLLYISLEFCMQEPQRISFAIDLALFPNLCILKLNFIEAYIYSYSTVLALLFGGVCYDLNYTQTGINDRLSVLNLLCGITPFMSILACIVQCKLRSPFTILNSTRANRTFSLYSRTKRSDVWTFSILHVQSAE
jgi:hypothetical protein